jgi:hypothetical protein
MYLPTHISTSRVCQVGSSFVKKDMPTRDPTCHIWGLLCIHDDYGHQIRSCSELDARVSHPLFAVDGTNTWRANRGDSNAGSGPA